MRTESVTQSFAASCTDAATEVCACDDGATTDSLDREQALMLALLGRPELLLGFIASDARSRSSSARELDVRSQSLLADNAERSRADAMRRAEEAAEKASGFLGLSGVLGKIVGVASAVASVAASVATGGAAAAVVGAVLLASAGPLTDVLAKSGAISPGVAKALEVGLALTGAILLGMAPAATAVGGADLVSKTADGAAVVARAVALSATAAKCVAKLGVAVEERRADDANASSLQAKANADRARDRVGEDVDAQKSVEASYARVLKALEEILASRNEGRTAATQLRA